MGKQQILEDLEALQDKVDKMGFKGQNEYDLHLRHEIADYIVKMENCLIFQGAWCEQFKGCHQCPYNHSPIK